MFVHLCVNVCVCTWHVLAFLFASKRVCAGTQAGLQLL